MTQTIEAIYQNGIFRPITPVSDAIVEGKRVQIVVSNSSDTEEVENPIIAIGENFYDGLSEDDIEEIERIALDRSNFFGDRHP